MNALSWIRVPTTISFRSPGFERIGALLSFVVPTLVRWIPETQFPYPIGFDTPLYISWGRHFASNPTAFPLILPFLGVLHALGGDLVFIMKYLPSLLYGFLGFSAYHFSRSHLGWPARKSMLAVLLVTLSFASLRISWDMHKQLMGIAFLLLALSYLKALHYPLGFAGFCIFGFLAAFSHELVLAVLITVLTYWILFVTKKELKRVLPVIALMSGILFLLVSVWWDWRLGDVLMRAFEPQFSGSSSLALNWFWEAETNAPLFLQLYGLILLPAALGLFKDGTLVPWLCLALLGSFFTLIFPLNRLGVLPYRWMLLLTYPFSFCAANGLDKLSVLNRKSLRLLSFTLILLAVNMPTWGFLGFVHQSPLFCRQEVFPETMASSSIPLHDIEATIWLTRKFDAVEGSVLVVHGHYFGWVSYFTDKNIITFGELYGRDRTIAQTVELARNVNTEDIYLLWYLDSDAYSTGFAEVAEKGSMKLYKYVDE